MSIEVIKMKCYEIIRELEKIAPPNYALSWDNVGLLAGNPEIEVKKIYIALDATDEVIKEAVEGGADMLITHHPLIFTSLKKVTTEDFIGRRMVELIQNKISYYAMHTNFDVSVMGKLAGDYLGLKEMKVLEPTLDEDVSELKGIGQIGLLDKKMSLSNLAKLIKKKFDLEHVKIFGELDKEVSKVAISPGSGKSMIKVALDKGAQVLITGDIDHHEGIDSLAQDLIIIDAGHYGIESIFISYMGEELSKRYENLEIQTHKIQSPFQIF